MKITVPCTPPRLPLPPALRLAVLGDPRHHFHGPVDRRHQIDLENQPEFSTGYISALPVYLFSLTAS